MLKLVISAACLWVAALETAVLARAADLSGPEINELLAGATIELDTPVGTKLPVRYGRDGKLLGDAGDLAWYLGAQKDRGRWWVEGGQLCHQWDRWFDAERQCLRLRKAGRVIHWRRQDGKAGTATVTVPPPKVSPPLLASSTPSSRPKVIAPPEAVPKTAPVTLAEKGADKVPEPKLVERPKKQAEPSTSGDGPSSPQAKVAASETGPEGNAATKDPVPPSEPVVAGLEKSPPKGQAERKGTGARVYKVANVRSDDVLNVRSGPSADFNIVAVLPPGTGGIAITSACKSQWCPVKHHGGASGWVNRTYLTPEEAPEGAPDKTAPPSGSVVLRDAPGAPRSCLAFAVRALLARIELRFGPVQVISTCRPGATIRGTWRPSRHASGNAVDFKAGSRKAEIVAWLIANHRRGGTMTYANMDHIHVDIGPYFVSIAGGPRWASWRGDAPGQP